MQISDAAVEAAVDAHCEGTMRAALEAAAPHMLAGQVVATTEELDALPVRSVIISSDGYGEVYSKHNRRHDGIKWYEAGYENCWESGHISLPAKVLHVGFRNE